MSSINVTAYDIDYDTDGEDVSLPTELAFSLDSTLSKEEIEEMVSDKISDETGFCHKGFRLRY